jgi:GntR family transcriptional regulator
VVMVMPMPPVDRASDRPAYKQVADGLRERLDAGEFDDDSGRLPSEKELMEQCRVSRATARKGLGVLIAEGRAEAKRGRGVFAKGAATPKRLVIRDPSRTLKTRKQRELGLMAVEASEQGFDYRYTPDIKDSAADARVASLLRVEEGAAVLARRRLVRIRPPGSPWRPAKIANSYFPSDCAVEELRHRVTHERGSYARLIDSGYPLSYFDETIIFRMPTPAEARRLQLADGIPVIDQTRVAFSGDRPVECFLAVMAGDVYELEYRIDAKATTESRPVKMPSVHQLASPSGSPAGDLDDVPADLDPTDDRPLYKQIADWLRTAIERGLLAPNTRLPSETKLMRRFHTTRTTVRRALEQLANEGRVRAQRGVGVFVKAPVRDDALIREPYDRMARHRRQQGESPLYVDAATQGISPAAVNQDHVHLDEVAAPPHVAEWLRIDAGTTVFRRRRRMWADNAPTQITATYLPLNIAVGALREEHTGDGGTHARIEDLGHELTEFVERLSVRMPTDPETRELRLEPGVPVVDLVQTTYAGERPVECFTSVIAGDRYVFRYRVDAA